MEKRIVVIPRSKVNVSNLRFSILVSLLVLLLAIGALVYARLSVGGSLDVMLRPIYWPFYLIIIWGTLSGVFGAYYFNGYSLVDNRYLRVRDNWFIIPCKLDIQDIVKIDHLEYYSMFNHKRIALRIRFNKRRLIYRIPCELYIEDEDSFVEKLLELNPNIHYTDEVEHDFRIVF